MHAIIEELARRVEAGEDVDEDARKIGDLFASFMDVEAIAAKGTRPIRPLLAAVEGCATSATWRPSWVSSSGSAGTASSGPTSTPTPRTPTATSSTWSRAVSWLPRRVLLPRRQVRRGPGQVRRLPGPALHAGRPRRPAGAAATVLAIDTWLAAGHWERAETRDVQKTYNLMTKAESSRAVPDLRLGRLRHQPRRLRRDPRRGVRAAAVVLLPPLRVLEEVGLDEWRRWLLAHVLRATAGYLTDDFVETNFDFYGAPQRHLGAAGPLEARRRPGRGRDGRGGGQGVRRPALPPHLKAMMDELVANLLVYRQSISKAGLDDRRDQAARLREARHLPAQDRLPREVPRLRRLQVTHDDLLGNVAAAAAFETDRQLAKIGRPWTATSGSCCPRRSTPTTTPAPTRSASPPGSCRSRSSPRRPRRPENYGGIGAVIGHEIGHGSTTRGAPADGAGNLHDWWTPDDKAAFEVKSKALIEQYDGFEPRNLPGERVNGALTVGENIGDPAG